MSIYVHLYVRSQLTTCHITYFDQIRIKHVLWFNIREIIKPTKADYITSFGMITLKYLKLRLADNVWSVCVQAIVRECK